MPALPIRAHRKLPGFLVTTKEVGPGPTSVETPAKARPVELFEDDEEGLLDPAYGFAEIHVEVSTQDLNDLANGSNEGLEQSITEQKAAIREDEIPVAIVAYSGRGIVNIPGMEALVSILDEHVDVLVGLLMSEQLDSADLDANPETYDRYVENTERFLGAVAAAASDTAVLGTIPVLSRDRMEELFDIQYAESVDGFSVDFLDKKPTAKRRINRQIAPLMERLGEKQSLRSSLLYAVNAYRGQNRTGTPRSPAEDFFVFGLGFDVLGGRYYFSRSGYSDDDEIRFRWFDSDTFELEYVPVANLPVELPEDSGLDHQYIMDLAWDDDHRGRAQVLLEAERMSIAYEELRDAIHAGCTAEYVTEKAGTLDRIETRMETVQDAFDDGRSSPSVTSY